MPQVRGQPGWPLPGSGCVIQGGRGQQGTGVGSGRLDARQGYHLWLMPLDDPTDAWAEGEAHRGHQPNSPQCLCLCGQSMCWLTLYRESFCCFQIKDLNL